MLVQETVKVNSRCIESLVKVGAFDDFGDRAEVLWRMQAWQDWAKKERQFRGWMSYDRKNQVPRPDFDESDAPRPMQLEEKLRHEMELMGQHVSGTPMDGYDALEGMMELITGAELGTGRYQVDGSGTRYIPGAGIHYQAARQDDQIRRRVRDRRDHRQRRRRA